MDEAAVFQDVTDTAVGWAQLVAEVSFHLDHAFGLRVQLRNIAIARYEIIHSEGTAFAFIVSEQDDANVLDRDDQGKGPDDERKSAEQIIIRWLGTKCTRVDIERARANVAVDDSNRLVRQPHERPCLEFLLVLEVALLGRNDFLLVVGRVDVMPDVLLQHW